MRFRDPSLAAGAAVERVRSDAEGAPVRALIGGATPRIISADQLAPGIVTPATVPARPFLAYRIGPSPDNGGFDQHGGAWFIYDDVGRGHAAIGQIALALAAAYDTGRGATPLSVGPVLLGTLTEPQIDAALGLRYRRYDLTILT